MKIQLEPFVLFEGLNGNKNLQLFMKALDGDHYSYYDMIRNLSTSRESLSAHLITAMIGESGKKLVEFYTKPEIINAFDKGCLNHDLRLMKELLSIPLEEVCKELGDKDMLAFHLDDAYEKSEIIVTYEAYFEAEEINLEIFIELLGSYGAGPYAFYPGFYVQEEDGQPKLIGVKKIVSLPWDDIYHYKRQKDAIRRNTRALLDGKPFQNALLVGASGTGKSTSVKSIVNLYASEKLRMVQLQKNQLNLLSKVIPMISNTGFKYILFIDDLSFEANEDEYKFLKSFIEGSINEEMNDIAFYVTSNRRHLIKEIRSERENDIHLQDFIQEMTSLSDRFGLTLLYEGLSQKEFFQMVRHMAYLENLNVDIQTLDDKARIYAMRHGKMSGRVAAQFIKDVAIDL